MATAVVGIDIALVQHVVLAVLSDLLRKKLLLSRVILQKFMPHSPL